MLELGRCVAWLSGLLGLLSLEETFLCMHGVHRQVCLLQRNFAANAFFPPSCLAIWKGSIWSRWSPLPRLSRWRSCCWCFWFPVTTILFPFHLILTGCTPSNWELAGLCRGLPSSPNLSLGPCKTVWLSLFQHTIAASSVFFPCKSQKFVSFCANIGVGASYNPGIYRIGPAFPRTNVDICLP